MRITYNILLCIVLLTAIFHVPVYAQNTEVVLVNGSPPLTQLMVGKTIVLLDWVLDLKLSKDQELKIKDIVVNAWKSNNKAAIKSTTDIINLYEQVFKLSSAEQSKLMLIYCLMNSTLLLFAFPSGVGFLSAS